jgi:putative FmdB family regulatory protein
MPVYDARCNKCEHTYEFRGPSHQAPGSCPSCSSDDCRIVWLAGGTPSIDRAKDPYDMLTGKGSRPGKKIISGPKYSSKTTT